MSGGIRWISLKLDLVYTVDHVNIDALHGCRFRMDSQTTIDTPGLGTVWRYVWVGLVGHLLWGSYPVFAKRAVAEVPKFSLLLVASLAVAVVGAAVLRWHDGLSRHQVWVILQREPVLWVLAAFMVLRSVTNIISIELTHAIWIQLINILAPFPVALLGTWFFGEPVPRYTYRALVLSTVGAVLMLVQDWSQVLTGFSTRDLLGLGTAVLSTLALATYFQLVRRTRLHRVSGGVIVFQQGITLSLAYVALSWGFGENWSAWTTVTPMGWLAVVWIVWLVQVLGTLTTVVAVEGITPALVTSLMALRLVSALTLGWLILGERLVAPAQWLGMLIVVLTVTAYLWLQNRDAGWPRNVMPDM